MARRALVIGSRTRNLRGAEPDAKQLAGALGRRGFEVDVRVGERASRTGILEGYDELIAKSEAEDVAVIFYSGHGFWRRMPDDPTKIVQAIVPTDLEDREAREWRGITSWELSIKLAQLTEKTRNVAVLLDCCYAGSMSKDPTLGGSAQPRYVENPMQVGFERHLATLRELYGRDLDPATPLGNPNAVRIIACGQSESAHELTDPAGGGPRGAFTAAVVEVLDSVEDGSVTWEAFADMVRARVVQRVPTQFPYAEGPAKRRLFSLHEDGGTGVVVNRVGDELWLQAGKLMGVVVGDVYAAMPGGSRRFDADRALGMLTVTKVATTTSVVELVPGAPPLALDAVAFPRLRHGRRQPVAAQAHPAITAALDGSHVERVAAGQPAIASLAIDGAHVVVADRAGELARLAFPEDLPRAVHIVENLAAVAGLREQVGPHGIEISELGLDFGKVVRGERVPLPLHGGELHAGDVIYLDATTYAQRSLYVHVLAASMRGTIQLASPVFGHRLAQDEPLVMLLGDGTATHWPAGVPPTLRRDELFVIVTPARTDLRALQTRPDGATPKGARSLADDYLMQHISWLLHPTAQASA